MVTLLVTSGQLGPKSALRFLVASCRYLSISLLFCASVFGELLSGKNTPEGGSHRPVQLDIGLMLREIFPAVLCGLIFLKNGSGPGVVHRRRHLL